MLAIRMQRLGRKGHPTYRVVVQDVRQTPTSGKVVAMLGSYDPHTKTSTLVKDKAEFYLSNGAQPSDRVVRLLQAEGIKLPSWVKSAEPRERTLRNPEKLRRNQPEKPAEEVQAEAPAETPEEVPETEAPVEAAESEAPAEKVAEAEVVAEAPAETEAAADEAPAEEDSEKA